MIDNLAVEKVRKKRHQTVIGRVNDLKLVVDDYQEKSSSSSERAPGENKQNGMESSQKDSNGSKMSGAPSKHSKSGSRRSESKGIDANQNYDSSAVPL